MLDDALRAYALQDYRDRQLLIINDGQPLRSLRNDVQVVNWSHGSSIGAKRQASLRIAGQSWAATWDDDDFAFSNHLSSLIQTARTHNSMFVESGLFALANTNLMIGCIMHRQAPCTRMVWAPLAEHVGGYPDVNYGEDWALFIKFKLQNLSMSKSPSLTYVHRRHLRNVTHRIGRERRQEDLQLEEALEDLRKWPDPTLQTLQELVNRCRTLPVEPLVEPV